MKSKVAEAQFVDGHWVLEVGCERIVSQIIVNCGGDQRDHSNLFPSGSHSSAGGSDVTHRDFLIFGDGKKNVAIEGVSRFPQYGLYLWRSVHGDLVVGASRQVSSPCSNDQASIKNIVGKVYNVL
jgi:hypothetical protein